MTTNVNLHAPAKGLGDSVAKALVYFGVSTIAEATMVFFGLKNEGDVCTRCEGRRVLMNEIFPYSNSKRKIKFKITMPLYNSDGVIIFTCIKGDVIEIDKDHPLAIMLFPLNKGQIFEEVI